MKSLRSTEYGSAVSDGKFPLWLGAISVVVPQAAEVAPSGLPCTVVVTNRMMIATQLVRLKAYTYRYRENTGQ